MAIMAKAYSPKIMKSIIMSYSNAKNAIYNKYGKDYFTIEIIKSFNRIIEYKSKDYREVLLKYEEEYILNLNPDFNIQRHPYTNFGNTGTGKPTYQYSLEGDFIRRWESRAEVIRTLGFSPENGIRNQSAGGFQ